MIALGSLALVAAPATAAVRHHATRSPRACANANRPATASSSSMMRHAVVCLINQQRTTRGLPRLRPSHLLDRSAQTWTDSMVTTGAFWHGVDFAARISAVGFRWQDAGENIATGFPSPSGVVGAWMASEDHCRNILDPSYTRVGTGISAHPVGTAASGPSSWTQDFALPIPGRAPSRNTGPENRCPY